MKGDVIFKILRTVGEKGIDVADLTSAILDAAHGTSSGRVSYKIRENRKGRTKKTAEYRGRKNYVAFLSKLKNQGFISEEKEGSFLRLTAKGSTKLARLKEGREKAFPVANYDKEMGNNFVIIAFDVPEESRRKRVWLRSALKNMGLSMLQKSVWLGKVKIPSGFIDDLASLKLIDYVEVLEISKTGSLKRLG